MSNKTENYFFKFKIRTKSGDEVELAEPIEAKNMAEAMESFDLATMKPAEWVGVYRPSMGCYGELKISQIESYVVEMDQSKNIGFQNG